eukprot:TRINITY_DN10574_c0_g1_i2.p1 TRINITY_DN10574_c0_g1~~TRINITY_DN10574_c0_g1_i2.p1  ORF type:complete len:101 (-),score=16.46 TRINITY_DN10574_c0_g1_i2:172-432(-)
MCHLRKSMLEQKQRENTKVMINRKGKGNEIKLKPKKKKQKRLEGKDALRVLGSRWERRTNIHSYTMENKKKRKEKRNVWQLTHVGR